MVESHVSFHFIITESEIMEAEKILKNDGNYEGWHSVNGVDINANAIPDAAMTLATVALCAKGKTAIRDIYNWRVKETDRINAICTNLLSMGIDVVEKKDGFVIDAPNILHSASIKSFGDHRIAMAFTIAGLNAGSYNKIEDIDCVNISFPEFFETLKSIIKSKILQSLVIP